MNLDPGTYAVGTNGPFIIDPNCTAVGTAVCRQLVQSNCECCGIVRGCEPCYTCLKNTCTNCDIGGGWEWCCLICGKSRNLLSNKQQERLESLYLPDGYRYEQAKQKLTNL
jgi:hypothetical protein